MADKEKEEKKEETEYDKHKRLAKEQGLTEEEFESLRKMLELS